MKFRAFRFKVCLIAAGFTLNAMCKENPVIIVPENPGADTIDVSVVKVFDGDGFLARIKAREVTGNLRDDSQFEVAFRCGFIDAPELGQPGGYEAKEFLTSLIAHQSVELVVLTKSDTGRCVDRHGRIVCVPFLTQEYSSGEFRTTSNALHTAKTFGEPLLITRNIELEMLLNGWAWVLERYGPDERYFDALENARYHKRGIWAFENNIHPWEFKKQKPRKKESGLTPELFGNSECPMEECNGHLVKRVGRFGAFLGCSNFPTCKYSRSAGV